jgi:hypothetical protein
MANKEAEYTFLSVKNMKFVIDTPGSYYEKIQVYINNILLLIYYIIIYLSIDNNIIYFIIKSLTLMGLRLDHLGWVTFVILAIVCF